jgi:hypothetical protein
MSYPANDNKAEILYPNQNPPNPYNPPVTMQPGVSGGPVMIINNNNNNNQSQRFAKRPWTHGLCDCFGDIGGCLCAWCFPLCYKYSISEAMGEGCCTCFCASLGAMRAKIRGERGIQVSCFCE